MPNPSFTKLWVFRAELYPLYLAMGAGIGLAAYYPLRILSKHPDTYMKVTAESVKRNSDPMDPDSERYQELGQSYTDHKVRKFRYSSSNTGLASYTPMVYDVPEYEKEKREAYEKETSL